MCENIHTIYCKRNSFFSRIAATALQAGQSQYFAPVSLKCLYNYIISQQTAAIKQNISINTNQLNLHNKIKNRIKMNF